MPWAMSKSIGHPWLAASVACHHGDPTDRSDKAQAICSGIIRLSNAAPPGRFVVYYAAFLPVRSKNLSPLRRP
jgi:hypothetical protein